jgi:hypothetical protein
VAGGVPGQGVEPFQVEAVHLRALRGEALADRQPDTAGGPGDGDAPSLEAVGHRSLSLTAV